MYLLSWHTIDGDILESEYPALKVLSPKYRMTKVYDYDSFLAIFCSIEPQTAQSKELDDKSVAAPESLPFTFDWS